jgi:TonB family protein
VAGGVLNGKAIILPKPTYPKEARAAGAHGAVSVQVLIGEDGKVISAAAVSGDPLLREAAVEAAKGAVFSPTKLSGVPVKVSGIITYNFVASRPLKERLWTFGSMFSLIRSSDPLLLQGPYSGRTMQDLLKAFAKEIPVELKAEQALFDDLARASDADRPAATDKLYSAIKTHLNEEENWKLDAAFYTGNIMVELKRMAENDRNQGSTFDISKLESHLRRVNELAAFAPKSIASDLAEKVKAVGAYANSLEFGSREWAEGLWNSAIPILSQDEKNP